VPDRILYFEDVEEGTDIPPLVKRPSAVALFRYSAVTWNPHRIHYDETWARHEGYPGILVQAHLHGAYLAQMVMGWIGPTGLLRKLSWSNRRLAVPGDTLTCKGKVRRKYADDGLFFVECEIWEENQEGEVCAPGSALVILPTRRRA
jgi:hydroxyacyl-ACP dehydratase HTD2-like protein with hotdog domain